MTIEERRGEASSGGARTSSQSIREASDARSSALRSKIVSRVVVVRDTVKTGTGVSSITAWMDVLDSPETLAGERAGGELADPTEELLSEKRLLSLGGSCPGANSAGEAFCSKFRLPEAWRMKGGRLSRVCRGSPRSRTVASSVAESRGASRGLPLGGEEVRACLMMALLRLGMQFALKKAKRSSSVTCSSGDWALTPEQARQFGRLAR